MNKPKNVDRSSSNQRPAWILPVLIVVALGAAAALFALLSGASRDAYVPEVTGAPHLDVDQTIIDHGDQPYNNVVESVFNVRNVGDQPLIFSREPRVEVIQGC